MIRKKNIEEQKQTREKQTPDEKKIIRKKNIEEQKQTCEKQTPEGKKIIRKKPIQELKRYLEKQTPEEKQPSNCKLGLLEQLRIHRKETSNTELKKTQQLLAEQKNI